MSHLFSPASIGTLNLRNRFVVSPMQQYRGDQDANASEYHVQHYGRMAKGGAGLILVESDLSGILCAGVAVYS